MVREAGTVVRPVDKLKRRYYVSDPDACRMCRHGQNGCPGAKHLGKGKVIACLGYFPAMEQV